MVGTVPGYYRVWNWRKRKVDKNMVHRELTSIIRKHSQSVNDEDIFQAAYMKLPVITSLSWLKLALRDQ